MPSQCWFGCIVKKRGLKSKGGHLNLVVYPRLLSYQCVRRLRRHCVGLNTSCCTDGNCVLLSEIAIYARRTVHNDLQPPYEAIHTRLCDFQWTKNIVLAQNAVSNTATHLDGRSRLDDVSHLHIRSPFKKTLAQILQMVFCVLAKGNVVFFLFIVNGIDYCSPCVHANGYLSVKARDSHSLRTGRHTTHEVFGESRSAH